MNETFEKYRHQDRLSKHQLLAKCDYKIISFELEFRDELGKLFRFDEFRMNESFDASKSF